MHTSGCYGACTCPQNARANDAGSCFIIILRPILPLELNRGRRSNCLEILNNLGRPTTTQLSPTHAARTATAFAHNFGIVRHIKRPNTRIFNTPLSHLSDQRTKKSGCLSNFVCDSCFTSHRACETQSKLQQVAACSGKTHSKVARSAHNFKPRCFLLFLRHQHSNVDSVQCFPSFGCIEIQLHAQASNTS